jgi:hypothetical protein
VLGIELPNGPIENGGTGTVTLPPATIWFDATQPGGITLGVFGVRQRISVADTLTVTLDGAALPNPPSIPLASGSLHRLEFTCNS